MATMTKASQPELDGQPSAGITEDGRRKEMFRLMEASTDAIERQIASAVENARVDLLAENDRLRGELEQAQQMLAGTEEAAAIALERQITTAVERAREELLDKNAQLRDEFLQAKQLLTEHEQLATERERANQLLMEAVETQRATLAEKEKSVSNLQAELKTERDHLSDAWESEREKLSMECGELRHDCSRLKEELGRLADSAAKSDIEKTRLREECEKLNHAFASMASASRDKQEADIHVLEEAARVETAIREISRAIESPETEVSTIIRKNVERAQLDAYLRGLRFSCDGK